MQQRDTLKSMTQAWIVVASEGTTALPRVPRAVCPVPVRQLLPPWPPFQTVRCILPTVRSLAMPTSMPVKRHTWHPA
jgi:ligand-binding SRPBCC domain-containing protein